MIVWVSVVGEVETWPCLYYIHVSSITRDIHAFGSVLCSAVLLQEASKGSDTEVAGICSKEFIQWFIWLHFKECTYGLMNSRAGFCKPVNLQTCKAAKLLYPSHNLDYTVSWIADSFKVAKESYRSTLSMIIILMFFPGNSPPNETGVKVALCR